MLNTLNEQYSRVSKAAATILNYQGTIVSLSMIRSALRSWQMHLKRIAPYLTMGKGIWWATKDDNYHFYDADNDLNIHEEGPDLLHFRNSSLDKLWKRNEKLWEEILERRVILPTPSITIYNQQGTLIERRLFTNDESTPGTSTASHI